jgi:hypothetical protein
MCAVFTAVKYSDVCVRCSQLWNQTHFGSHYYAISEQATLCLACHMQERVMRGLSLRFSRCHSRRKREKQRSHKPFRAIAGNEPATLNVVLTKNTGRNATYKQRIHFLSSSFPFTILLRPPYLSFSFFLFVLSIFVVVVSFFFPSYISVSFP